MCDIKTLLKNVLHSKWDLWQRVVFVIDIRHKHTFLRNNGIKVGFKAEEFSFTCVTY